MSAVEGWVEVIPHDDRWILLYQIEAAGIRSAPGGYALEIEHFGSTAVPRLVAKPIVDILVGVREGSDPRPAIDGLARLGYEYLGEDARRAGRYFWRKRGMGAFNVSVLPHRGELWESNLAVRDFLRVHPGWVDRYGRAKEAAAASATSMLGYQDGKREFVVALRIAAAVAWAGEHRVNER